MSRSLTTNAREWRNRRLAEERTTWSSNNNTTATSSYTPVSTVVRGNSPNATRALTISTARRPSSPQSRPPIVSPNLSLSHSRSWEDDKLPPVRLAPRYGARRHSQHKASSDRSVSSELGAGIAAPQASSVFSDRSVVSESFLPSATASNDGGGGAEAGSPRSLDNRRREIRRMARNRVGRVPSGIDLTSERRSPPSIPDDDVSSLGGVEDHSSAIQRMTLAIRNQSARPSSLTREERALWDAVHAAIHKAKASAGSTEDSEPEKRRSLRAIQRVLADVTAERDKAVEELSTRKPTQSENAERRAEMANVETRIRSLENELREALAGKQRVEEEQQTLRAALDASTRDRERLTADLGQCREELATLTRTILEENQSTSEQHPLTKELAERTASLENAKMIIASLENANGTLAADTRTKLKARDDVIMALRSEATDRKKALDSIATQLRDVQLQYHHGRAHRKEQENKRVALSGRLEKNMADMRAASVILEATNDATAASQVADILVDSITALKDCIELVEEAEDSSLDVDSTASAGGDTASVSSRSSMPVDVRRLRRDLDERTRALARSEEALRRHKDESSQFAQLQLQRDEEVDSLRQEVASLREQCQTNMEVLTRKERELVVLRDSLKVDDAVGYISDDGTDASDSEEQQSIPSSAHLGIPQYGPSQAEALATLLAHGGHKPDMICNSPSQDEVDSLKNDVLQARSECDRVRKQLKTEKESLANAKMIISSLEKANKSMMEDLRSRLHDSNTAIASLLEKSMESEKTTNNLRAEIEVLRKEKKLEKERYESELKKVSPMTESGFEEKKEEAIIAIATETID